MAALIQFASGAPGIKYSLDKHILSIGREADGNDICLPCAFVSKRHAQIEVLPCDSGQSYEYYLQDLGSTNYTYVNDVRIERVKLEDGDIIRIGRSTFKFDSYSDPQALIPLVVELAAPASSDQSNTWNFTRRLRVLGA